MKLQVLPSSQKAFSAYGGVIETQQRDFFRINNGLMKRYHDLTLAGIPGQNRMLINIDHTQPANLPLTIHKLGHHPLGTQAFILTRGEVFVVVVALSDDKLDLSTLWAFIANGEQEVNHHRDVWHHPLFAWQRVTDSLAIDHGGSDNCDVEGIPEQGLCLT